MNKANATLLNLAAVGCLALFLWGAGRFLDGYKVQIINLIAVNIILALSLNLIYGFTGLFSLGHAGFMAIGAYVCAMLVLTPAQKEMLFILEPPIWPFSVTQAPFFVAVLLGGLAAAAFGVLIGFPVLRLGGDYLGIATLGFAEIIRVLANNLPRVTNGALGLKGIPAYANLWWNYAWCLLTLYCIVKLVRSNFGNFFISSKLLMLKLRLYPRPVRGSAINASMIHPFGRRISSLVNFAESALPAI